MKPLLSSDHFGVDGTLIKAWASMKSDLFKDRRGDQALLPKNGRNAEVDIKGQTRSNETHASTTDPEARLYRNGSGREAKLCFIGYAQMESRSALIVDTCLTSRTATPSALPPWR